MIISRLEELFFRADRPETDVEGISISSDDFKECNYLLETIHNTIDALSHSGWISLLTQSLSSSDKHNEAQKSEGTLLRLQEPYSFR